MLITVGAPWQGCKRDGWKNSENSENNIMKEKKKEATNAGMIVFARSSPPFLPHSINSAASFNRQAAHAMEVKPFPGV